MRDVIPHLTMKRIIKTSYELMQLIRGLKLKDNKTFFIGQDKYRIIKVGEKDNE